MDSSTLKIIEKAAEKLYQPKSVEDGRNAEQTLAYHFPTFSESTFGMVSNASPTVPMTPLDSISNCQYVLERSDSTFAQMFAISQLKTLAISHFSLLLLEQKLELMTKLGWYDSDDFQNVLNDLGAFLQPIKHAKEPCAASEDSRQFSGYAAIASFPAFAGSSMSADVKADKEERLVEYDVQLIKSCLSFDFIGTNPDEASEDVGSISSKVPASWKSVMSDLGTLRGLFEAYNTFPSPRVSSQVMECLSLVISCRRSLFNEEEKTKLLSWILEAITEILRNPGSLDHDLNYHQFCRMLVRLRTVHQVKDIIEKPQFRDWIDLITSFTLKSFQHKNWSLYEVLYLLTFWSKMVTNIEPPPRQPAYDRLEELAAQVAKAFIASRIKAIDEDIEEAVELLEDEANLSNILELIAPTIRLRVKYNETSDYIKGNMEILASQYQDLIKFALNSGFSDALRERIANIHAKFTWCVYIIGSSIGQRTPYQIYPVKLFRKSYFAFETNQGTKSKVYHRLAELFALNDQYMVLNVVMQKM
ncbi:Exportin 7 [Dinochytrium kinnereticum]|nr:Exportin 7 [Dinochytrium kinnereticum]